MKEFILFVALALTFGTLRSFPDFLSEAGLKYLWFAVVTAGAIFFVRMISFLLLEFVFMRSHGNRPTQLVRLLSEILLYGLAAGVIGRFVFHVDLIAILSTSALLTAIIGFSLRPTLGHFFAGISLQTEQRVRVGDDIKVGTHVARVESLTWRSISARTCYGSVLVIPNSQLANETIEIFPADQESVSTITILVSSNAPPQRVIEIISEVILSVPHVKHSHAPMVQALDNHPETITYQAIYYLEHNAVSMFTDAEIKKRVWYALRRHNFDEISANEDHSEHTARFQATILASSLFTDLNASDREFLASHATSLLYSPHEFIQLQQLAKNSLFLISCGSVNFHVTKNAEGSTAKNYQLDRAGGTSALPAPWPLQDVERIVERISAELALYIGPLAPLLVNKAAAKTSDPYWLYRCLAEDISNPTHRKTFLRQAPRFPVVQLGRGDLIGDMSHLTGVVIDLPQLEAAGEVELFELNTVLIEELFSRKPEIKAELIRKVTVYQEQLRGILK